MDWLSVLGTIGRLGNRHGWRLQDVEELEAEVRELRSSVGRRRRRAEFARWLTWAALVGGLTIGPATDGAGLVLLVLAPFTHLYRRVQERSARSELATAQLRAETAATRRRKAAERHAEREAERDGNATVANLARVDVLARAVPALTGFAARFRGRRLG